VIININTNIIEVGACAELALPDFRREGAYLLVLLISGLDILPPPPEITGAHQDVGLVVSLKQSLLFGC